MSEHNEPKSLQILLARNALKYGKPSETSGTQTGNRTSPLDHDTKLLINMIFARLHHIYTHRFESAYGDETTLTQAKREWAFSLAGTTREQIEYALERCKLELAWPPTIAEFVKYLQPEPEHLGLPSTRDAYLEACQKSHAPLQAGWSHAAVHLAARRTGHFQLRSEPEKSTWPAFQSAYKEYVAQVAKGERLVVDQPAALPEPDLGNEDRLVQRLLAAGIDQRDAYQMAYYMEKPIGSSVRSRYRQHSLDRLAELALDEDVSLPD